MMGQDVVMGPGLDQTQNLRKGDLRGHSRLNDWPCSTELCPIFVQVYDSAQMAYVAHQT